MADWVGADGSSTARRYLLMAQRQLDSSPSYRALCFGVAKDAELLTRLDALPAAKRQPNLLLAAVRYLDGPVTAYPPFRAFVLDRWDEVAATMLARRTQTNEPRRCATLLPALAAVEGPIALIEAGASAGLCLYPDRYAYRYDDGRVLGDSPLVLDCATDGRIAVPQHLPEIVWRRGLDLNPLDVTDPDTLRWLECLIWPEHTDRFATLRAAAAIAAQNPAQLVAADITTGLTAQVADAPADVTLVIIHSAVLAYLDDGQRTAFRAQVSEIAAMRPTVWLSNEAPGVVVDISVGDGEVPFVLARDGEPVALTGQHGAWIHALS